MRVVQRTSVEYARPGGAFPLAETYIKVKGKWKYLYRAVDSNGQTLDFMFR